MGCHTRYRKLLIKGKENVQKYLRNEIDEQRKQRWWNQGCENEVPMRLDAIDKLDVNMDEELLDIVSIDKNVIFIDNIPMIFVKAVGFDIDAPRIGGYPNTIIKSADEMFEAMEKGLVNWKGIHYNFYWDKQKEEYIRNNITEFFKSHPDGIIEFG